MTRSAVIVTYVQNLKWNSKRNDSEFWHVRDIGSDALHLFAITTMSLPFQRRLKGRFGLQIATQTEPFFDNIKHNPFNNMD